MADIVNSLKHQARILNRQLLKSDPASCLRLTRAMGKHAPVPIDAKRRDCLTVLARETGFRNWPRLLALLEDPTCEDFGTLFYTGPCYVHFNIWSVSLEEARTLRAETNGYLLGYRQQYMVVDENFIRTLGLDPRDEDWERLGWDMTSQDNPEARRRIFARMIRQRLTPSDPDQSSRAA